MRTMSNIVGEKIKQLRMQQHLRQEDVSQGLLNHGVYISQKSLSTIEIGTRRVNDYEILAFARLFGVPVDELMGE